MTIEDKIDKLIELEMDKFSSKEIDFISNMINVYEQEFTEKQEQWINDLYGRHFGKDD